MTDPFPRMVDIIPEQELGAFATKHYTVSDEVATAMKNRALVGSGSHFNIWAEPGKFCKLTHLGRPVMSDSGGERATNLDVVEKAKGRVLLAGLGLGMILFGILPKPEVTQVTVVEISPEVQKLVLPHIVPPLGENIKKLRVMQADIYQFLPSETYHTIYFDIWNVYGSNTFEAVVKLYEQFRPALEVGGWMAAWQSDRMKEIFEETRGRKVVYPGQLYKL